MKEKRSPCLENPMDGGAWGAAVHGVAKSWTRLSDFTFTFHFHVHTMEYYSAIKNEIMPLAAMWVDLEMIILYEVSQTEKDKSNII